MLLPRYADFTPDELARLCWLRAVEWLAWPAFLSQPLLPILYVYYPVRQALMVTVLAGFVWILIRYNFMNLRLADLGCLWVRLKWITIPIGCLLLLRQGRYAAVVILFRNLMPWSDNDHKIPAFSVRTSDVRFRNWSGSRFSYGFVV